MPPPMVLATMVPRTKAATKLKNAAQSTAFRGESTRVDTTVAMELAASWKPLRKSKARATRMMSPRTAVSLTVASGALHDDGAQDVGEVLALVAGVFQNLVDLLPLEDLEGTPPVRLEEIADDRLVQGIGLILQLGDADGGLMDLPLVRQIPYHAGRTI